MLTSGKDGDFLARNWKRNKRIDDILRSSNKNKRICKDRGETTEISISGNQSVWSELREEVASNLSKSVVSLAFSNEHEVLFACSGIAVERVEYITKFLTSASLAKALIDKGKDHGNLKVEVRCDGNVFTGFLGEYDLDHNIAVVNVMSFPDVRVVLFNNLVELPPHSKVVALGRGISGKLMATSGELTGDSSGSQYIDELKLSSCKIPNVHLQYDIISFFCYYVQ